MKCEHCGKRLRASQIDEAEDVLLCAECTSRAVTCDGCGETLPRKQTVTCGALQGKPHTLCRTCLLKDEQPIEVVLVRSSWAPWGEEPVTPMGDLLCNELSKHGSRRKVEAPLLITAPMLEVKAG